MDGLRFANGPCGRAANHRRGDCRVSSASSLVAGDRLGTSEVIAGSGFPTISPLTTDSWWVALASELNPALEVIQAAALSPSVCGAYDVQPKPSRAARLRVMTRASSVHDFKWDGGFSTVTGVCRVGKRLVRRPA